MKAQADRAMMPSAVRTFLFTDIEGSTRRWESDPDAMRAALQAHDQTIRRAVTDHGGEVFKHTGDGVCAAFTSPRGAVDAAIAAQRRVELPVRMGLATGEAQARDGDYFGAVLNRAARVMAAGHGGQILLDGATVGLLSGIDLLTLGHKRLRDITQAVEVFQVRAQGLAAEFPPLRTMDRSPGNLRTSSTNFIGRDRELTELTEVIQSHRLVTLTGVGGVGKTRLAMEVASRIANDFADGVWVIELASVGDPAAVPDAVAATMGIAHQPGLTMADSVASALERRTRLLVFDNCEHVLDATADLIEAILSRSLTVKILATSREGVRLANERLWPIASLDTQAGLGSAAATLFVDRASAMAPGCPMEGADDAIIEICRRLDGIPLAIELAASRLLSMTVTDLRDRLDDRFRLLVGSRRGLERHQTLRQAVAWSYDLLNAAERALLQRCSVFAGGFDLAAACAVAGSSDDYVTLDLLNELVRKSLVVTDHTTEHTRFSMLETIRQFAEEQLVATGGADQVRTAHARYYAGLETDVLALWDSSRQREAYDWLALELANLRAAFRWAADRGDLDSACAVAFYAAFLGSWVDQHEPIGWAEEMIESARAVDHPRLAQLYVMGAWCSRTGRVDEAVMYADAAQLAIARGLFMDVPFDMAASLGIAYVTKGQPRRWLELCRGMFQRGSGTQTLTRSNLVMALVTAGAVDEAGTVAKGLIAAAHGTVNPAVACHALVAIGYALMDVEPAAAYDALQRGLTIAQASGNKTIESYLAVNLSMVAPHGDPADTFALITLAIHNLYDSGSYSHMSSPLGILAVYLFELGRHVQAATIIGFAATTFAFTAFPRIDTVIAQLRDVLGDEAYESSARAGSTMTNAAMTTYALDQIDQARAQLE